MLLSIKYPSGDYYLGDKKISKLSNVFDGDLLNEDLSLNKRSQKQFLGIGKGKTVFIPRLNTFFPFRMNEVPSNIVCQVRPVDSLVAEVELVAVYNHIQSISSQQYMKLFFPELNYDENSVDLTPVREIHNALETQTPIAVFSIDPSIKFANDIDDAVSFYFNDNKLYFSVHIADVSRYLDILGKTLSQKEICRAIETIYTTNEVYHMLPKELMEMCSLNPNENHYAVSVNFELDLETQQYVYNVERTVVRNVHKMNYEEADLLIETDENFRRFNKVISSLKVGDKKLNTLFTRNSYYFIEEQSTSPYVKVVSNDTPSHALIEKLMILANNKVQEEVSKKGFKIFRHHPSPSVEPKSITEVPKAVYSPKNKHYALGLETYNHFTSPIRRYMDVCVHRALFLSL